ncbi:MAG: hypothetical protein QGH45_09155 [Myxococcota bacterium]|nr:hypothetical protein [Myxococcota bacterium]
MTRRQRIVLVGATAVLGTSPLPAVGEPAGDDTALLRVVTPGTSVEIAEELEGGHRVPLGDTRLGDGRVRLLAGPHRICLVNAALGTLCRELELAAGEEREWIVWPTELATVPAWIELPDRVRAVRIVVDGEPGSLEPVEPGAAVPVPPLRDVWLEMRDGEGAGCLCHPPLLPALRRYRCPWPCDSSSDR